MAIIQRLLHYLNAPLARVAKALSQLQRLALLAADKPSSGPGRRADLPQLMGMDYARFSALLPYRYVDETDELFINNESLGFALEVAPLNGANEDIIHGLAELIKNKLDHRVTVQVMLMGSPQIERLLAAQYAGYCHADAMFQQRGKSQYDYLRHAALHGFHSQNHKPIPLRDHRCFIFVNKRVGYTRAQAAYLCDVRQALGTELSNLGLSHHPLSAAALISLLKSLINLGATALSEPAVKHDHFKELHEQMVDPSFELAVAPNHLTAQVAGAAPVDIVALSLKTLPDEVALWAQADNLANVLKPGVGIPCPFVLSVHFKCEPTEKSKLTAFRKATGYEKKAHSPYAKLIPGTVQAAHDWKKIRDELAADAIRLCKVYYNCVLFTPPEKRHEQISSTLAAFRLNGLELYPIKYQQLQAYLALMPFVAEQGLWRDLNSAGRLNTMTSWNLANMLPLVADHKGAQAGRGFFAPTFRYQAACIDFFDPQLSNYNGCIAATSGSGKSVLGQSLIGAVLAEQGQVWVIDMGESYKKYCDTLGGTYLDVDTLQLNPFSHVDDIAACAESIRDLLAVMAAPSDGLSDVQKAHLLDAVNAAYAKQGAQTNIDDVIDDLSSIAQHHTHDLRIADMITLLGKYSLTRAPRGSYAARVFNETSLLSDEDKPGFVVLELSALEAQPELLKAVLFALMLNIEQHMYRGSRARKKLCVIDEAWRLLNGSNQSACEFIEKGFRTARRNNASFVVISQKINDFHLSEEAKAAWSCSENKIIMRQNSEEFDDFLNGPVNYFTPYETQVIKRFMPSQVNGFSEFMIRQGEVSRFHRLFLDPFARVMYSSRAQEHQAIKDQVAAGVPVSSAIAALAWQLYGDEIKAIEGADA